VIEVVQVKAKVIITIGLVLGILVGAGIFVAQRGISVGGVEIGGTGRQWLADRTYDFLEDLQFKDFKKASSYHLAETQKERNIPDLIQRVFQVRHEVLDIMRFEIIEVDLDRSKSRARVRTNVWFRLLGDSEIADQKSSRRQTEILFYWFLDSKATPPKWNMELASSL